MRPATERMAASKGHKNTLLSDAGRPVWYDYNGQSRPAFVMYVSNFQRALFTLFFGSSLFAVVVIPVIVVHTDPTLLFLQWHCWRYVKLFVGSTDAAKDALLRLESDDD